MSKDEVVLKGKELEMYENFVKAQATAKLARERRAARIKIMMRKAKDAGIKVSDEEIEKEMSK